MKFLFAANKLISNPYPNWNVAIGRILSSSEAYIYFDPDESDTAKESLTAKIIEIFDLTNPPEEISSNETQTVEDSAFFDLNPVSDGLRKGLNKQIGFLGFGKDFETKLKIYEKKNYSLIISEVLPCEIQEKLADENLEYFLKCHYFLPPDTNRIKLRKSDKGMIVLIHDSKESPSQSLDKRILGVLNEHERLRVIDFHTHEPSVEIEASTVYSLLSNPQLNHALRQACPFEIKFLSSSKRVDSPFRDLYFEHSTFNMDNLFVRDAKSIRAHITEIINSTTDKEINVSNNQILSPDEEVESLINKIKEKKNTPRPYVLCNPKSNSFSLEKLEDGSKTDLPTWLLHPATEPSLHSYLKDITSSNRIHQADFYKFADVASRLVHLLENEGKYLSNFNELYGEISNKNLSEFDAIIKNVVRTYGIKGPLLAELHSRLVAKHCRLAYEKLSSNDHYQISSKKAELLLGFLDEGKKIDDAGVSPEMIRVEVLCFSGCFQDALAHCEKQENQSHRNILLVTVALLAAICDNAEACASSLESYSPLRAQYAPDYVNAAYLIARLYTEDLTNDQYQQVLAEIVKFNLKPLFWLTELSAIAILKASSSEDSNSVIYQAEAFLLGAGSLTPESIQSFQEKSVSLASGNLKKDVFSRLDVDE